jgi:glutaredoxin 3
MPRFCLARPAGRDRDPGETTIDTLSSHGRFVLYTASFCAECERARALFERRGVPFEEVDLSADPDRCCELETLTGGRSTPQLVIDGRPIGGFAELSALDRAGGFEVAESAMVR